MSYNATKGKFLWKKAIANFRTFILSFWDRTQVQKGMKGLDNGIALALANNRCCCYSIAQIQCTSKSAFLVNVP